MGERSWLAIEGTKNFGFLLFTLRIEECSCDPGRDGLSHIQGWNILKYTLPHSKIHLWTQKPFVPILEISDVTGVVE